MSSRVLRLREAAVSQAQAKGCTSVDLPLTPALDRLLGTQLSSERDVLLAKALIGRTLFPVGQHDDWQVALALTGRGDGKTTLADLILSLCDTFVAASVHSVRTSARLLAKAAVADLLVVYTCETDGSVVIDDASLEACIVGALPPCVPPAELTTDAAGSAREWTTPTLIVGNIPCRDMPRAAWTTRLAVIPFTRALPLEHLDSTLATKLHAELPQILFTCALAYIRLCAHQGTRRWSSFAPPHFCAP